MRRSQQHNLLLSEFLCSPKICYVEILTTKVMVLGCGAFGRWLGHEGSMHEISALMKETQEAPFFSTA